MPPSTRKRQGPKAGASRGASPAEPRLSRQRTLENLGGEPVFSDYSVTNPASGGRYRVAIRGAAPVFVS